MKRMTSKAVISAFLLMFLLAAPLTLKAEGALVCDSKEITVNRTYFSRAYDLKKQSWFSFIPETTGSYRIRINGSRGIQAALYDSTKTNLMIENKASSKLGLAYTLVKGNQYYIKITIPKFNLINSIYSISIDQLKSPNDTYFAEQWALLNSENGLDINVVPVWSITQGEGIKIGIIDTGTDYKHPDLNINKGMPLAYNFIHKLSDVFPVNEEESGVSASVGHGTIVAGIIGAEANNEEGICGTAPRSEVVSLKILGAPITNYSVYDNTVATFVNAVKYAQDNGIKIINCSFGGSAPDTAEREAMEAAKDILFVIAAGNAGNDLEKVPIYPACYDLEHAIVVAAVNSQGELSCISNYGEPVQIAAPGEEIASTYPDSSYVYSDGTSMAASFVSGVSALVWAQNPKLTAAELKQILIHKDNVTPLANMEGKISSGGMINAFKAMLASESEAQIRPAYNRNLFSSNVKEKIKYHKDRTSIEEKTNMLIVKVAKGIQIDTWIKEMKKTHKFSRLEKKDHLELIDAYVVELSTREEADQAADLFNQYKEVIYAEPNYIRK